jgi:cellulose synthase operon protein C
LKCFRSSPRNLFLSSGVAALVVAGWTITIHGELPSSIRDIEAGTAIEAAFFRLMSLPGGAVLFPRPPRETRPALDELIKTNGTQPRSADLYSLRALEDEQQLDFTAAESDWKLNAENASDKTSARIALADFYHRRVRPLDEAKVLFVVANAPPDAFENLVVPSEQQSWRAFERIFGIIQAQGLPREFSVTQYRAWLARYPQEQSLYARFLDFLVSQKDYGAAGQLIADYHKQFPDDEIFPVKAKALVEYRQGSVQRGLAVYEQSFQPLWAPELVKSYFDLLAQTQSLRKFLDQARAALNANPEDLNAMARTFYYYQQEGKLEAAQQVIADFRAHKEATKSRWTGPELYVCARLLEGIHVYPESARYYFALYNSKGMTDAQENALAGLTNLLLTAPETPIRFGTGELSLYRDIATMDQGPGYLNGILSLLLNSTEPGSQYSEEEQRAIPYFHRSRAAELLALLDARFPNSAQRAPLHAQLLDFYAGNGESEAVIRGGREFLAGFPNAPQRTAVALLMADGYARAGKTENEFAIYDSVLKELAARAQNVPLGNRPAGPGEANQYSPPGAQATQEAENEADNEAQAEETSSPRRSGNQAFQVGTTSVTTQVGARSPEYARVLERYLARLVELKQIPAALGVLRREIDRNPDDPGLYERLAVFLDQNRLGAEQEEIYRRAMARFPDRSWYDKLARFYLRYKENAEFEQLTQEAVKTFRGTDLERYFANVVSGGTPVLYVRLNQYANQRFPHDPVFVHNLLAAYSWKETYNQAAWEALLRQHWFEEAELRNWFFGYLSGTNKLEAELSQLQQENPAIPNGDWQDLVRNNPAAAEFLAQADLWQSHFEGSAPVLKALADEYPADFDRGRTASAVYRSLAYLDPAKTTVASKIEDRLLQADPGNTEIMARIGDIYADRDLFDKAAPYWDRIPQVAPGLSNGYLDAATIYWDYFDYDNALRLLHEGRKKLGDESLYSYEAGAIYENQRDYPDAIRQYLKGSLTGGADSQAERRLLQLAPRAKFRDEVDQETAKAARLPDAAMPAVYLRVKVLEAQGRKQEMANFLDSLVSGTTSIEQAEDIESLAKAKSLEAVRQHALEKQAALTTDPVTRLQLRYALVGLYEGRKDFQSAQRNIEAVYRESPKILGVVRSTVDFYWRMKMAPQAIAVLMQAAKDAYPDLSKQFAFEAARKSTEAREYQQARDLLTKLLEATPYDGEYLAAMADTYAQAGDDQGLRQFYLDRISLFRNAPFSADERKTRVSVLRRGLIPALTRMKDYAGAVDQYIELINSFPEDETLVTEAALYALRCQRQEQLVDFYQKTMSQSPRDYRWSMVLARIETSLENFPAAIDTYAKAIVIRPDRVDLRVARAGLEERLIRLDDAVADYEHIYQLAYKDPQWMAKVAEVRARQGRDRDVVAALKTALIDGRPESAGKYFEAARRLESWGILDQARAFAEQGVQAAGADLLATSEPQTGAKLYTRIITRLRQEETAYATLERALQAASSSLPVIQRQVAQEGIAAITDKEWRERMRESRVQTARQGMTACLTEMGGTVASYFTPEEKVAFAHFAETRRAGMSLADVDSFAIPLAESARLADLEARWRYDLMMEPGGQAAQAAQASVLLQKMGPLVQLQRRRLKFAELGRQLEQFAPRIEPIQQGPIWAAAAKAYRAAGDSESELRMLASSFPHGMEPKEQKRFLELLLARQPQELVRRSSAWDSSGETAADYAVANGEVSFAHAVVSSRGASRPAVWRKSYNALVGLYFAEATPEVRDSFVGALGDQTIAERLAKPVDRSEQLAGDTWFYYGSRYGEYLGVTKQGNPDDFLPAILEQSPGTASAYVTVADYYADSGKAPQAISDYGHAVELAPGRADVLDRLAMAYYQQGSRATALAQWKQVFSVLTKQVNSVRVPESFWTDFGRTCDHLRSRRLFAELKPDADTLLRAYLRRNGNYRSNALLYGAYTAVGDPTAATSWLLDLAAVAHDPTQVLADVVDAPWIPLKSRAPIYERILQVRQDEVLRTEGLEKEGASEVLRSWQVRWIKYLVAAKQYTLADDALTTLPKETRDAEATALVPLELQVAAKLGTLETKIAAYRSDAPHAPNSDILRAAARQLFEAGDKQSARKILEFVFAREIDEHKLVAANFLGLAEIRIAAGDPPGALELLRRLVVVVGNPFENLDPAAALLEKTGHDAEAVEFLQQLVKSAPWEPQYRLRLAKANLAAGRDASAAQDVLVTIASGAEVPYNLRAQAALALRGARQADLHSEELNLLAGGDLAISGAAADQPFFYEARLKAAQKASDSHLKVQLLGNALADAPLRDDARLPLFQAAVSQQDDQFALGVLEPLLRANFLFAASETSGEEQIISEESATDEEEMPPELSASAKVPSPAQAQLAWAVGNVMVKLNRLGDSLPYFQAAFKLEKTPARRQEIKNKIADVRAVLRRQQLNAGRQPILHEALEQDRVVRPRLVARAAPPAKTAVQGGSYP